MQHAQFDESKIEDLNVSLKKNMLMQYITYQKLYVYPYPTLFKFLTHLDYLLKTK